jgi:type VI protein secretion system component VasA
MTSFRAISVCQSSRARSYSSLWLSKRLQFKLHAKYIQLQGLLLYMKGDEPVLSYLVSMVTEWTINYEFRSTFERRRQKQFMWTLKY